MSLGIVYENMGAIEESMWLMNTGLCLWSIIGCSHGWLGWTVDSSTIDIDEVDEGGEGGSLGSTVCAASGEEACEEDTSLEGALWVHLNSSKSDLSASICDNRSAIVGDGGDWEGGGGQAFTVWGEEGLDLALSWACWDLRCTSILFW